MSLVPLAPFLDSARNDRKVVAAFVSKRRNKRTGAWHKLLYNSSLPFAAFCPRNFAWMKMSILPSITSCTLLVSAPVR